MPQFKLFIQLDLDFVVAGLWVVVIACYFPKALLQLGHFILLLSAPTKKYHVSKKLCLFSLGVLKPSCPSCPQLLPFLKNKIKQNKSINRPMKGRRKYPLHIFFGHEISGARAIAYFNVALV